MSGPLTLMTWNVNGIEKYVERLNTDPAVRTSVICLQETKCAECPTVDGYECHASVSGRRNGVALYVKKCFSCIPVDVSVPEFVGRVAAVIVTTLNGTTLIVSVYFPNAGGKNGIEKRLAFDRIFDKFLSEVKYDNLVVAGDFNCCVNTFDHHTYKTKKENRDRSPEVRNIVALTEKYNLHDVYLSKNGKTEESIHNGWTYWSNRYGRNNLDPTESKPNGNGWRIDYVYATNPDMFSKAYVLKTGTHDHSPLIAQ